MAESLVAAVAATLAQSGVDLEATGLAWARATPVVVLVPAFGLRALPAPGRMVLGLALAMSMFPALRPVATTTSTPWEVLVLLEMAKGLPVAIAAAVPLWAATMAGGVVDALRGSQDMLSAAMVEGRATPLGVPLSVLASAIFLATGGPSRVLIALAMRPGPQNPVLSAVDDIVHGIGLAVALAGPLLSAAVIIEIAAALVARAASPAQVHALLSPLRAIATLAVVAMVFERLSTALARAIEATP